MTERGITSFETLIAPSPCFATQMVSPEDTAWCVRTIIHNNSSCDGCKFKKTDSGEWKFISHNSYRKCRFFPSPTAQLIQPQAE